MNDPTLDSWLEFIRESDLIVQGEVNEVARTNLLSFSMSTDEARATSVGEIERFLAAAAHEYSVKLAGSTGFWFYAWFDEMSGTLRCSAGAAKDAESLPFGCKLIVHESPTRVAELLLSSNYLDGIPWSELEEVDPEAIDWDTVNDEVVDVELEIFARPLSRHSPQ